MPTVIDEFPVDMSTGTEITKAIAGATVTFSKDELVLKGFTKEATMIITGEWNPSCWSMATIPAVPAGFKPSTEEEVTLAEQLATLEALGSSKAIARFFYDEGVRGERHNSHGCPAQKWIQVTTGGDYVVGSVAVYSKTAAGRPDKVVAQNPAALSNFIAEFDSGVYPQLATGNKAVMSCECPMCSPRYTITF
jgi:hypothetical protein